MRHAEVVDGTAAGAPAHEHQHRVGLGGITDGKLRRQKGISRKTQDRSRRVPSSSSDAT